MIKKRIWWSIWIFGILQFLILLFAFFFTENGLLHYGIAFFNSTLLLIAIALNFMLRHSIPVVKWIGWITTTSLILLAIIQMINERTMPFLWTYSLLCLTVLAGTVLYRTIRTTIVGRIVSIVLTLAISGTLLIGADNYLITYFVNALLILAGLSSLYLIFKAEINE